MNLGKYQILHSVGKGGMGEVFLAYDSKCGRNVALKQMGPQWQEKPMMRERFLKEAKIAAQLSHPNIIPIYTIDETIPFYTMPYVEGETLKEIFHKSREQAKNGEALHPIGSSIPALIRIFLNVCGAIGYAHAKGILHRDLKPENIIIGKYGEVIILDWGLANFIDQPESNGHDALTSSPHLTQPGKIPGTLLFMAPERALGAPSSIQTDIYSLGVVLYQVLTLQFPFHRKSLKEYRKFHEHETILDPEEVAPDRDISPHLSSIAKKCLAKKPEERYRSIEALMEDLERYSRGDPEWLLSKTIEMGTKSDWQFQESIPLASHMALTRGIDMLEWFNLMVSKAQYPGNLKIETRLTFKRGSQGLGFLFSIPETNLHKAMEEAYCLWLSPYEARLYRTNVEVFHQPLQLTEDQTYLIRIEHVDNMVRLFINGIQKLAFLNHIPLPGSRLGLLLRDGHFSLKPLHIFVGSQNIMVNCLAIPDAFLARKNYDEALLEYRKISHSFPGRPEGREATFRAGLTLLKKGREFKNKAKQILFFTEALGEFEKLHNTPGAPLEYLGKSYIYKAQGEFEEEAKCLELALRKFPKHPLKPILVENILSRLHESSKFLRQAAYRFALIILRYLPHTPEAITISVILEKSLEPLPFFTPTENKGIYLMIQLAFWLNKPLTLLELIEKGLEQADAINAHVGLILLGCDDLADLKALEGQSKEKDYARFENALKLGHPLPSAPLPLWKALKEKDWGLAKKLVGKVLKKKLYDEKDPHFFLYGCYLAKLKGQLAAEEHFTQISEEAFPPTTALLSHYLKGRIDLKKWMETAFYWEKLKLLQQLELYSACLEDSKLQRLTKSLYKTL